MTVPRNRAVVIALVICLSNIVLVSGLAAVGGLETAERGDIHRFEKVEVSGNVVDSGDPDFVVESPTDIDFFWNIVIYYHNTGFLYPGNGRALSGESPVDTKIQLSYKYFPLVVLVFIILHELGYLGFKLAILVLSVIAVVVGTVLFMKAEFEDVNWKIAAGIAILAVGFEPMVANFKTGQTTPFMYLFIAIGWYYFRQGNLSLSGGFLAMVGFVKPYFLAPSVIYDTRWRGLLGLFGILFVGNLLAVLLFGVANLTEYYSILISFLIDEGATGNYSTFQSWNPTHFRPFYWLGPVSLVVRGIIAVVAAYITLEYFRQNVGPVTVFSVSLTALMLVLKTISVTDLGMLLAVFVVLGSRFYQENTVGQLTILLLAFLLVFVHSYILELLVGTGTNLSIIASNEALITSSLPLLQSATYGVLILLILSIKNPINAQ